MTVETLLRRPVAGRSWRRHSEGFVLSTSGGLPSEVFGGAMAVDGLWLTEGAGNDFLVGVGSWSARLASDPNLVVRLCRRHRGIGADGVLALEVEREGRVRLIYRNADGSRARFCANGTRCAAMAAVHVLDVSEEMVILTDWAEIPARVVGDQVSLHVPTPGPAEEKTFEVFGREWTGILLKVGVPHLVISVDAEANGRFAEAASALRWHPALGPDGANVSFIIRHADGSIGIRTYERGVEGETLCCGSAVIAAGVIEMAARDRDRVTIRSKSGDVLCVEERDPGFVLTGPARLIAEVKPVEREISKLDT